MCGTERFKPEGKVLQKNVEEVSGFKSLREEEATSLYNDIVEAMGVEWVLNKTDMHLKGMLDNNLKGMLDNNLKEIVEVVDQVMPLDFKKVDSPDGKPLDVEVLRTLLSTSEGESIFTEEELEDMVKVDNYTIQTKGWS